MSGSISHAPSAEPNLTPLLDMVFQLITFFMLVINFKSASMEQAVQLPVVGSAMPVDVQGHDELLVLNVNAEGKLLVYGAERDVESYIAGEAQASLNLARRTHPELKPGEELPAIVVIRADHRAPFTLVNRVLQSCQKHGYRRFSLKTRQNAEET